MGKRAHLPASDLQNYVTPPIKRTIRKRKIKSPNANNSGTNRAPKTLRLHSDDICDDEDESSSSNDVHIQHWSTKQANNSSILLNSSFKLNASCVVEQSPGTNESPRPVYSLRPSLVNGTILYDLTRKPWRLGNPIGKGNFGEIFLASDNITVPVTNENATFVVKIEPHSNGPLFVEIHCLMNTAKKEHGPSEFNIKTEEDSLSKIPTSAPCGIPDYIASGSHYFGDARYRFLVLQRFDRDLHSLIKNSCISQKSLLTLAIQIVNVLEKLHDRGYCHNDVKSQNLMISKCRYYKSKSGAAGINAAANSFKTVSKFHDNYEEKQPTTDSGNSSEQEANDDLDEDFIIKRKSSYAEIEDDEDFDDGTTTSNSNSNSMDVYKTPLTKNHKRRHGNNRSAVQYSGTNPVRSCRRPQHCNSTYEEMVNSHYLRPSKRISYSEFFSDDNDGNTATAISSEDDSIGFAPALMGRRCTATSKTSSHKKSSKAASAAKSNRLKVSKQKRLTRRQEKLLHEQQRQQEKDDHKPMSGVRHFGAIATKPTVTMIPVEVEHIFLIDFGLASKYIDDGVHRPFVMDQRRAHDGTLEFTSRDAHMGAHSRRSDLECLGYNLLFWSQGFLPWKEYAAQHQQEKVHRAKEYLMTDVREMLKQIYGKDVPKYLGEFLHLVGQLAYHERPQYARYRRLFEREYQQLGYSLANMCLNSQEISRTSVRIKKDHGAGKHDIFELNNKLSVSNNILSSIMKSGGTPFQERGSLADRVSPKNLRSKSDKKLARKKKFTWAEILSQDPDQIARERAEKEFDRELVEVKERPIRRFEGKPTYAILDLLKKNEGHYIKDEKNIKEENESAGVCTDGEDDDYQEEEEEDEEEAQSEVSEDGSDEEEQSDQESDSAEYDDEDEDVDKNGNNSDYEDDEDIDTDDSETSTTSAHSEQKREKRVCRNTNKITKRTSSKRVALIANSRNGKKGKSSANAVSNDLIAKTTIGKKSTSKRANQTSSRSIVQQRRELNNRFENIKATGEGRKKYSRRQQAAASAAGEVTEHALTRLLYEHGTKSQHRGGKEAYGRPKRRCLTKTDTAEINGSGRIGVEDDSNSNFSPDVRILFNVWKKMSNESLYAKGTAANALAATAPVGGGGGMVTRHYRK